MKPEFVGIERRLARLNECLQKLEPLRSKTLDEFLTDTYLRDIVERNLEIAAQCCIDISNRIVALENAPHPHNAYESLLRMGELGILSMDFARQLAPLGGFRNILVHQYLDIDWNIVYSNLTQLDDLKRFAEAVRQWMARRQQIDPYY
jgi:uncharacterized protein YutE (UPF0331/DUF86 family)